MMNYVVNVQMLCVKNNPYTDLKPAAYAKIIRDWKDSYLQYKSENLVVSKHKFTINYINQVYNDKLTFILI